MPARPLSRRHFRRDPRTCAQALLGCEVSCGAVAGRVVETEAYSTIDDPACHTAFRRQARAFVEENREGAAYVYLNYGVYHLLNILTKADDGEFGFVLIRALEPSRGLAEMKHRRGREKETDLCSGPGKLTIALGVGPHHHGVDLCGKNAPVILREGPAFSEEILTGPRIGISQARDFPWRFGLPSAHLSKPFPQETG